MDNSCIYTPRASQNRIAALDISVISGRTRWRCGRCLCDPVVAYNSKGSARRFDPWRGKM